MSPTIATILPCWYPAGWVREEILLVEEGGGMEMGTTLFPRSVPKQSAVFPNKLDKLQLFSSWIEIKPLSHSEIKLKQNTETVSCFFQP